MRERPDPVAVFAMVDNLVRLVMLHLATANTLLWSGSASWMPCGGSARQVLACHEGR